MIQLWTTGIIPYKCVIYTAWRGTNHSFIPHNHVSYVVSAPVRQYASSISYATASHTKWMVTRPVRWDVRFIVTLWTPFSSFIHSFNQISWVWLWETFFFHYHSFNRFLKWFTTDFFCISMHAFCRVSYAILWYTRYDTGYGFSWFDPHLVIAHWITMNMPYPVPYPVWKCLPYGSTHPLSCNHINRPYQQH